MIDWLKDLWEQHHPTWHEMLVAFALFLITFVGSLAFTVWLIVRLPATYFRKDHPPAFAWEGRHPLVRALLLTAKNVIGFMLVVAGIIMSLPGVPGQGLLTILLGVMLLDFPGRRRFEIYLVTRPRIRQGIEALRARFDRPPLVLDEDFEPTK